MEQYRVLVVDDSAFMRKAISQILEQDPQFTVIGIARNGLDAIEKVQRHMPDLVTMDVEMPEMNGLKALEEIKKISPVSVVMLSSYTGEGAMETLDALNLGAVDFFLKNNLIKKEKNEAQISEFLQRLKAIAQKKHSTPVPTYQPKGLEARKGKGRIIELLFIGCSTGGPSALQKILPRFPKDFPIPIVVAQHMPSGFTKPLAERFNNLCQLNVREVENNQEVKPGTIYIAPSGFQTTLVKNSARKAIFKVENHEDDQSLYKPCIDITVGSAAHIYKEHLLSVILTGMGTDGTKGCELVKQYGGNVFVEAEQSCVVYGMPKSVVEAGYADGQYLLTRIYDEVISFIEIG